MANKKITELQLISAIEGDESIPADDGVQTYRFTPLQLFTYIRNLIKPGMMTLDNIQFTTSVGSSALTIAVKTNAGTDPSATDKARVAFRSSTLTSGAFVFREISSALSLVISSGSTLGQVSTKASRIYVYLIDNAGTVELAVSSQKYPEDNVVSTTAEGGAGAADSHSVIYSNTARTNVACRLLGYIDNTQTTAGTWASAGTVLQLYPYEPKKAPTVQRFTSGSGTYYTPAGCTRLEVTVVGPGGGGAGGGSTTPAGSNGAANSSFGSSLITANAGNGATGNGGGTGGAGGGNTINSPAVAIIDQPGGGGGASQTAPGVPGGSGGGSIFGGTAFGFNKTNTVYAPGAGGHGGPTNGSGAAGGSGGGAGGSVIASIDSPLGSYAYVVGGGGAGGAAGANGAAGEAGSAGIIIVREFYD